MENLGSDLISYIGTFMNQADRRNCYEASKVFSNVYGMYSGHLTRVSLDKDFDPPPEGSADRRSAIASKVQVPLKLKPALREMFMVCRGRMRDLSVDAYEHLLASHVLAPLQGLTALTVVFEEKIDVRSIQVMLALLNAPGFPGRLKRLDLTIPIINEVRPDFFDLALVPLCRLARDVSGSFFRVKMDLFMAHPTAAWALHGSDPALLERLKGVCVEFPIGIGEGCTVPVPRGPHADVTVVGLHHPYAKFTNVEHVTHVCFYDGFWAYMSELGDDLCAFDTWFLPRHLESLRRVQLTWSHQPTPLALRRVLSLIKGVPHLSSERRGRGFKFYVMDQDWFDPMQTVVVADQLLGMSKRCKLRLVCINDTCLLFARMAQAVLLSLHPEADIAVTNKGASGVYDYKPSRGALDMSLESMLAEAQRCADFWVLVRCYCRPTASKARAILKFR